MEQAADKLKRTEEMLRQATKDAILGKFLALGDTCVSSLFLEKEKIA